jgi:S1/P1 Nuclease
MVKRNADRLGEGIVPPREDVVYDFTGLQQFFDDHGSKGTRLDAIYDNRALPVVHEQLSRAGVRLAAVLNSSLK